MATTGVTQAVCVLPCDGAVQEMERIVGQLRAKWPKVRITLRADSSFARLELEQAQALQQVSGSSARVYTRESWSRERRVVGKAEYTGKGANPRFVVTSLGAKRWPAQKLYEELYCARGEAENRIKESCLPIGLRPTA